MSNHWLFLGAFGAAILAGCGGEEFENDATTGGEGGGRATTTGTGGGGGGACEPGEIEACYTGEPGTEGFGPCASGTRTCNASGVSGPCDGEVLPQAEDCGSAEDDDCDGEVNEAAAGCVCTAGAVEACYEGPAGTQDVGLCAGGMKTCDASGTAFGPCVGQVLPAVETCARAGDEDCDGSGCSDSLWSDIFGDGAAQSPASVAVDLQGNVYIAGSFQGALSFGGPPLISAGGDDAFLVKLDATGAHVWSRQFGDNSSQRATGVAVDPQGNVVVTGYFFGNITFGGDVYSAAASDGFLVELDPGGTAAWSTRFGLAGNQQPAGLAVDASGDVIVTGINDGSMRLCMFPPCAWVSEGLNDVFLQKHDGEDGSLVWEQFFGDSDDQTSAAVAVDPVGNVAVTGRFSGGCGIQGMILLPCNGVDAYVARFDPDGNYSWFRSFGDASVQEGLAVAMDSAGSVVVAGSFAGAADFGEGTVFSIGGTDGFVRKLSAAGASLWSRPIGSVAADVARGLTIDSAGNVVVAGNFGADLDLGGGTLLQTATSDIFLAKLAGADGAHLWSRDFGAAGQNLATALATGPADVILLAGTTTGTVDLGAGALVSQGGTDMVVGAFSP